MALPTPTRLEVAIRLARRIAAEAPLGLTKQELLAAVVAADGWIEDNAASFNAALPQPARGTLTTAHKAKLIAEVALARYGGD